MVGSFAFKDTIKSYKVILHIIDILEFLHYYKLSIKLCERMMNPFVFFNNFNCVVLIISSVKDFYYLRKVPLTQD